MSKRIYSLETEYAMMQESPGGPVSTVQLYDQIETAVMARHRTIVCDPVGPCQSTPRAVGLVKLKEGFFIDTGARIYYDTGHVEWACPECDCASDATVWDLAAGRELEEAARTAGISVVGSVPEGRVLIIKNNLDYTTQATYGCHENYSILRHLPNGREMVDLLLEVLPAFLVTRTILCGAGRLGALTEDPHDP